MEKNSSQPGFDSRADKPVASRFTECAIPAHILQYYANSNTTKFQHFVGGRGQGFYSLFFTDLPQRLGQHHFSKCKRIPIYMASHTIRQKYSTAALRNVRSSFVTDRLTALCFVSSFGSFHTLADCTDFTALQHRVISTNYSVQLPSIEV